MFLSIMRSNYSTSAAKTIFNLGKINHVAIATKDVTKVSSFYSDVLGAKISKPMKLPEHGVKTVFVELGESKIELLEPLGNDSPIAGFLSKKPDGGMHHICIELVDDIGAAMKKLKTHRIRLLSDEPKIGAHGKPVVFLHPKDTGGVLMELEQANKQQIIDLVFLVTVP
ncbi:Methylmalonyl-CoA epimerase, mitochondrial [Rozella allomycis CSF55]|uniref:Methylmalonyl-CoA epimerase, mitochondrial n=1 Tax=Rozella allomycis (strain CSF55) TaxID=988480 RepID=A0A075ARJ9_ROZAC|nr:Methylmalonyl-CoA epimerase, mitochondrial [Rozella allomycis CSF55]|eukprot:EPZ31127.1 Methylmalonyl-CoA epimerase, mitochondrial [Rozella allomycis CSF55]